MKIIRELRAVSRRCGVANTNLLHDSSLALAEGRVPPQLVLDELHLDLDATLRLLARLRTVALPGRRQDGDEAVRLRQSLAIRVRTVVRIDGRRRRSFETGRRPDALQPAGAGGGEEAREAVACRRTPSAGGGYQVGLVDELNTVRGRTRRQMLKQLTVIRLLE